MAREDIVDKYKELIDEKKQEIIELERERDSELEALDRFRVCIQWDITSQGPFYTYCSCLDEAEEMAEDKDGDYRVVWIEMWDSEKGWVRCD